jgi:uncharacterized ferritin-like protein (DUF455 family)
MYPQCCRPLAGNNAQQATHTVYRLEYAAIALATKHINKYAQTIPVILARHWLRLPDDGSYVNQNILEQILNF